MSIGISIFTMRRYSNYLFFLLLFLGVTTRTVAAKIPYAVVSKAEDYYGYTLTFKYGEFTPDNVNSWDVSDTGNKEPGWHDYFISKEITSSVIKVVFDPSFADARPKSCYGWFKDFDRFFEHNYDNRCSIDLNNLNTSEVTTMSYMFSHCPIYYGIDFNKFNTKNVRSMRGMFSGSFIPYYYVDKVNKIVNISGFNTRNVTDMSYMFADCDNIYFNDSGFDTRNVTDMSYMFSGYRCEPWNDLNLDKLSLNHYDTGNVRNMSHMFDGFCGDVVYRDTLNSRYEYFLTELGISNFDTKNVTDMSGMFANCKVRFDVSNFDTRNVTDMSRMFANCECIFDSLNLSNFDTRNVTDMSGMFADCIVCKLDVSHFDTRNVTNMNEMFYSICGIYSDDNPNWGVRDLDVSHFDTRNVTDMSSMFEDSSISELDVNNFDVSNVKDMSRMFANCKINTIYCDNDWTGVEVSDDMFRGCWLEGGYRGTFLYSNSALSAHPRIYKNGYSGRFTSSILELTDISETENAIYVEPTTVYLGRGNEVYIKLKNKENVSGYSLKIFLPDGIVISDAKLLNGRHDGHTLQGEFPYHSNYEYAVVSLSGGMLEGNDGDIIKLTMSVNGDVPLKDYEFVIGNIHMSTPDAIDIEVPDITCKMTVDEHPIMIGDINRDNYITISDAVYLISYVLRGDIYRLISEIEKSYINTVSDVNNDGSTTIADVVGIINIILNSNSKQNVIMKDADSLVNHLDPQ